MSERVRLVVDGETIEVPAGFTVAAAIVSSGGSALRRSVTGQPRGPLCGMGICFECRVSIDGVAHQRACMIPALEGMKVITDAG
jgi:sarcosine oxidase subunit alpha